MAYHMELKLSGLSAHNVDQHIVKRELLFQQAICYLSFR